jgi:hypothetical protein
MNFKFYYRVRQEFEENIRCIIINKDFSQQYRVMSDGSYDSLYDIVGIGYSISQVEQYLTDNKWRIGDARELLLILDDEAINKINLFFTSHLMIEPIKRFKEFTVKIKSGEKQKNLENILLSQPLSSACDCQNWVDTDSRIRFLTGHHAQCPHSIDPLEAAFKLISDLARGICIWASYEDGVLSEVWDAYRRAKSLEGVFLPEDQEET